MRFFITILAVLILSSCSITNLFNKEKAMNAKNISTILGNDKAVQTSLLFNNVDQKVIVLKIQAKEVLKEHVSKVPSLLVCVSGEGIYKEKEGQSMLMKDGDYVLIPQDILHEVSAIKTSEFLLIK